MRTGASVVVLVLLGTGGCESDEPDEGSVTAAIVGDPVATLALPEAARCPDVDPGFPGFHVGTSVAIVPAEAVDPTVTSPFLLATSCFTSGPARDAIYLSDPSTNPATLVSTLVTTGAGDHRGWGSLAYRADRGDLLGCTNGVDEFDPHHDVYRIDLATGAATFMFHGPSGEVICDGVAWDATTWEIQVRTDVSSTTYVYSETGTLLNSYAIPAGCPGSGIAVSGDVVFQACDGSVHVYELLKHSPTTVITDFPSGTQRSEDLECDPLTFASAGKHVIWTKEAYLDEVFAFQIPSGTCNYGGLRFGAPRGGACESAAQCSAGRCVDGVCCDLMSDSCGGECIACNLPGSVGTCAPADGAACDDGNACTTVDSCLATACVGGPDQTPPVLGPGTDQIVVGTCATGDLAFTIPTLAATSCDAGTTIACTPVPADSLGVRTVTCTATDPSGNVSAPVSFTVTVLQPLELGIQPPLTGDATPAAPDGSVDNLVKKGSTVPVNVKLFACGADVTATAAVTVRLGVTYKVNATDPPNSDVVLDFNGVGDSSGVMTLTGGQYHYNLSTKSYQVTGAPGNSAYYVVAMTAAYNLAPGVIVGADSIRLETR